MKQNHSCSGVNILSLYDRDFNGGHLDQTRGPRTGFPTIRCSSSLLLPLSLRAIRKVPRLVRFRVQIVEPQELAKDQAPSGYVIDNRQVQMTFAKGAEIRVGDRINSGSFPKHFTKPLFQFLQYDVAKLRVNCDFTC